MPTIILNKLTTNPAIPKVPVYGFFDDFNRADAETIGTTSGEGKTWTSLLNSASAYFGIRSNSLAPVQTGASGFLMSVVDAGASDGTLEAVYDVPGALKVIFRVQDSQNFLALDLFTSGAIIVRRYINNANTEIGSKYGLTLAGKTIVVRMAGDSVTVLLDGVTIIGPITVPEYTSATRHGVQINTSGGVTSRLDSLRFTPA